MTRNLKVLGLALAAVFAFAGIAASSAMATTHDFNSTSLSEKTVLTGTTEEGTVEEFFSNGIGSEPATECHLSYEGTTSENTVNELTVKPADNANCSTFEPNDSHVFFNHCAYVFHGETNANGDAAVDIECAEGSKIELHITGICVLQFGAQTGLRGVHYTNVETAGKKEVTVEATVSGIHFTKSSSRTNNFFCGLVPGDGTNGAYKGKVTVKGYETQEVATGTAKTTPTPTEEGQVNIESKVIG